MGRVVQYNTKSSAKKEEFLELNEAKNPVNSIKYRFIPFKVNFGFYHLIKNCQKLDFYF